MNHDALLEELSLLLRPPGQGIHAVSTGKEQLEAFTRQYLGNVPALWKTHLEKLTSLRGKDAIALLGVPSDTGAGIVRGASRGPEAIRAKLGKAPTYDLGDVFTVPHFLDDEMLSQNQIDRTRNILYPDTPPEIRSTLPVSPVAMTQRVYEIVSQLNPELKILLLGGDHTVTWPAMAALLKGGPSANEDLAIIHFDAHTDLLPQRLGVSYCFATWAYHANELLGRGKRLVQLGIRASGKNQQHWESTLDVKQFWAKDALKRSPEELSQAVIQHLRSIGTRRIYVSNDIDGTDEKWAAACGTPEPGGLTKDHVTHLIDTLATEGFRCIGADVVELAPGLSLSEERSATSIQTATEYVLSQLELLRAEF